MNRNYISINRNVLSASAIGSFDIYCEADNDKMILLCPDEFLEELAIHNRHTSPPSETLYIHKKEKDYYDIYVEARLLEILNQDDLNVREKTDIVRETIVRLADELFVAPGVEILYRYKHAISVTIGYVLEEKSAIHHLIESSSPEFSISRHSINVGVIGSALASVHFGVDGSHNIEEIAAALFLHDIGMITVPRFRDVISKPGKFVSNDWKLIHRHPEAGHEILVSIGEETDESEIILLQHHERHDGSGYPFGLKAGQIHPYAEICMIADTFDGLTSMRPYHAHVNTFKAISIMKRELFPGIPEKLFSSFVQLFIR